MDTSGNPGTQGTCINERNDSDIQDGKGRRGVCEEVGVCERNTYIDRSVAGETGGGRTSHSVWLYGGLRPNRALG